MADRLKAEVVDDIRALDKAIEDFIADLRQRASWDKSNVEDDGTVILPCGNGVLFRLEESSLSFGAAFTMLYGPRLMTPAHIIALLACAGVMAFSLWVLWRELRK